MNDEEGINLEIACPKCKAKPLLTESDSPKTPANLGDFVGRKCACCGHVFDLDDLRAAMADAAGEFLKSRFNK